MEVDGVDWRKVRMANPGPTAEFWAEPAVL